MDDRNEVSQYQCDRCGVRTRSPDEDEVVEISRNHSERQHDRSIDGGEVRSELRTLELESYPE